MANWVLQQDQWLVDDTYRQQEIVQDPVLPQDADPCVDPDQQAGPERQHDGDQEKRLIDLGAARNGECEWVADRQADDGRYEGDPDRVQIGVQIEAVLDQVLVVEEPQDDVEDALVSVELEQRRDGRAGDDAFRELIFRTNRKGSRKNSSIQR